MNQQSNTFLKSVKERAVLRIKEGRTRAVDLLALVSYNYKPDLEEFNFKDSIMDLLEAFQSEQEWTKLEQDLQNVPSSAFWDDVAFLVKGYHKYTNNQDLRNLLQYKTMEELENMLREVQSKNSIDEYWQRVRFMLSYLLKLHNVTKNNPRLGKPVGIEAYLTWRRKQTLKGSDQAKSGYDNSQAALDWAKQHGDSPLALYASTSPNASAVIPRFHAKAYMAIPWTRHNRSFYGNQNAPEAIPIGYEFKIFYPLLLDSVAPKYSVERMNEEYSLLWIETPENLYKSVAFKIKREEWDRGTWGDDGFCSQYESHLLHLRFWFKGKRNMKPV